jgi:hypothetical protein
MNPSVLNRVARYEPNGLCRKGDSGASGGCSQRGPLQIHFTRRREGAKRKKGFARRRGDAEEPQDLQNLLCLLPAQQLLEPRDIFEALFQGFRALIGVVQIRLTLHPIALLLDIEKLAQTLDYALMGDL